jgi:hypothetical protein
MTELMASSEVNCVSKLDTSSKSVVSFGLNGASIYLLSSFSKSIACSHGCLITSSRPSLVPSLLTGSFSKSYRIN